MHAYAVSDFSLANVAANSNSTKPLLYKLSGVWSNHEGSMLLWVFILALFGAAVALFGQNLPPALRARVLAVQAMIGVGFLLFILLTSNPFLRLWPVPADGMGLNPILQDPGLAFHPPWLYLGYVGFSITFCFAIAALIEGRVDPAWARWVRPWTLAAWCAPLPPTRCAASLSCCCSASIPAARCCCSPGGRRNCRAAGCSRRSRARAGCC